jgi:hypothetical protein
MSKSIFPYNLAMIMPFHGFERLSVAKNTNATFFRVGGSIKFTPIIEHTFFVVLQTKVAVVGGWCWDLSSLSLKKIIKENNLLIT